MFGSPPSAGTGLDLRQRRRRGAGGQRGGKGVADEVAAAGAGLAVHGAHAGRGEEILRRLLHTAGGRVRMRVRFGHGCLDSNIRI